MTCRRANQGDGHRRRWALDDNVVVAGGPAGRAYLWERIAGRSHLDGLLPSDPRSMLAQAAHGTGPVDIRRGPAGGVRYLGLPSSTRLADILVGIDQLPESTCRRLDDTFRGLAVILARLHSLPASPVLPPARTEMRLDAEWLRRIASATDDRAARLAGWLRETVGTIGSRAGAEGLAVIHGALHPGGIVVGADDLRILRWGSAGLGEQTFDLAGISGPLVETGLRFSAGSPPAEVLQRLTHRFLAAYAARSGAVDVDQLSSAITIGMAFHAYLHCTMVGGGLPRLFGILEALPTMSPLVHRWLSPSSPEVHAPSMAGNL